MFNLKQNEQIFHRYLLQHNTTTAWVAQVPKKKVTPWAFINGNMPISSLHFAYFKYFLSKEAFVYGIPIFLPKILIIKAYTA